MKRILIADDHDVVLTGLTETLRGVLPDSEIEGVPDSRRLLQRAAEGEWDLLIVDIRLPGRSGIDLIPDLLRLQPDTPILIVTAFSEAQYGIKAYRAGARGFIHKSSVGRELEVAVPQLLAGRTYVSPSLAPALAESLGDKSQTEPHELLSEREFEVMRLIADGWDIQQIASELALSANTVGTYRARIYRKLKVKNNVEIARYAMQQGLVD